MNDQQRVGGVAGLIAAATVVIGLGMFATLLTDYTTGDPSPGESVAFLADNEAAIFIWNLITLIVFSVALVPFALALRQRLKTSKPTLVNTATTFGFIWAGLLFAGGMILNVSATPSSISTALTRPEPNHSGSPSTRWATDSPAEWRLLAVSGYC